MTPTIHSQDSTHPPGTLVGLGETGPKITVTPLLNEHPAIRRAKIKEAKTKKDAAIQKEREATVRAATFTSASSSAFDNANGTSLVHISEVAPDPSQRSVMSMFGGKAKKPKAAKPVEKPSPVKTPQRTYPPTKRVPVTPDDDDFESPPLGAAPSATPGKKTLNARTRTPQSSKVKKDSVEAKKIPIPSASNVNLSKAQGFNSLFKLRGGNRVSIEESSSEDEQVDNMEVEEGSGEEVGEEEEESDDDVDDSEEVVDNEREQSGDEKIELHPSAQEQVDEKPIAEGKTKKEESKPKESLAKRAMKKATVLEVGGIVFILTS